MPSARNGEQLSKWKQQLMQPVCSAKPEAHRDQNVYVGEAVRLTSMLQRTLVSARVVANSAQILSKYRAFSTRELIAITDVRKGMTIKIEDKYCEVKEWNPHKQGRGAAAYNVTYDELDTGKEKLHKFTSSSKVFKIEPDREECQVLYTKGSGKEEKIVVLADAEYNEVEVPLAHFQGHSSVPDGATALLYKDDGEIMKIVVKQ